MKKILLYLWQLPQNVLALLLFLVNLNSVDKATDNEGNILYYIVDHLGDAGISLGKYIIFDSVHEPRSIDIMHEQGHQKQSMYLGPLYLIIVGIPSIVRNIWDRLFHGYWSSTRRIKWYYGHYPELWADKLGGVYEGIRSY